MTVIAWTEIELFHNIRKYTQSHPEIVNGNPVVHYKSKCKLHGSNGGIQIYQDGRVIAQSRTQELSSTNDNAGFAKFVEERKISFQQIANDTDEDLIIFGEWIGKGVQSGVACSEISKKSFAVFAARILDDTDRFIAEPHLLQELVKGIPDVYVLPWHNSITIDWSSNSDELTMQTETINNAVMEVEKCDPWIENVFGVKGTGEGLVFYPMSEAHLGYQNFTNLVFKAKGEKHKNVKTAAPAQVDASIASSVNQFVDMVLTESRLMQGVENTSLRDDSNLYDMKRTGSFLQWIVKDVEKETKDELVASNLEWKQVQKPLSDKARAWYIAQCQKL